VSCPSGTVTGEVTEFSASRDGRNRDGVTQWTVSLKGAVTNRTARPVRDVRVRVGLSVDNGEPADESVIVGGWIGTGSSANWTVVFDEYATESKPDEDDVSWAVTGWSWGEGYGLCPTRGSSS
jgi:hypothetical protein